MGARRGFTRRDVLKAGGAGTLALGGVGCASEDFEQDVKRDPDAPNVLLIVTDSTRVDYLGAYNPDSIAKTPNLDALAKQSLKFGLAVPESMPTGAVRRTLLSGSRGFPFRDWVESPPLPAEPGWTPIGEHQPILTEVLGKAGVNTAYCTDNPFIVGPRYAEFRRTLDMARPDYSQGAYRAFNKPFTRPAAREEIEKYLLPLLSDTVEVERLRSHVGWNQLFRRGERDYSAARVMRSGMKALGELTQRDGPFFLGVDSFDPHEPFDAPRAYVIEQSGTEPKGIEKQGISPIQAWDTPSNRLETIDIDDETLELIRELYAAEISFADQWIGRLLNQVDDMGLTEDTMVIYLSDHGLTLGEHGIIGKAASRPHYHIYHVPFMMRDAQGRRAGQTSDYFASTHDVARTVLSAMGVRVPGMMDGEDLTVLFDGKDPPPRPFWTSCYADNVIAGDGRWMLMSNITGGAGRRLFDTREDPGELKDVAADNPEIVEKLWNALIDEAGGSLPMFGQKAGVLGG